MGFDAIIGTDFLTDTRAIIDIANSTLSLYDGLTTVKMVHARDHVIAVTTASIKIPARSKAIYNATTSSQLKPGNYILELDVRLCSENTG